MDLHNRVTNPDWGTLNITEAMMARAMTPGVCNDCGGRCTLYMVHNKVWDQAWPEYNDVRACIRRHCRDGEAAWLVCLELCFDCLEQRLKRPLTLSDFTDAAANLGVSFGFLLGSRFMGARKE